MQSVSSRIWIRVAVSSSYDDNHYTTGTFHDYQAIYQVVMIYLLSIMLLKGQLVENQMYVISVLIIQRKCKYLLREHMSDYSYRFL